MILSTPYPLVHYSIYNEPGDTAPEGVGVHGRNVFPLLDILSGYNRNLNLKLEIN